MSFFGDLLDGTRAFLKEATFNLGSITIRKEDTLSYRQVNVDDFKFHLTIWLEVFGISFSYIRRVNKDPFVRFLSFSLALLHRVRYINPIQLGGDKAYVSESATAAWVFKHKGKKQA